MQLMPKNEVIDGYVRRLSENIRSRYEIEPKQFRSYNVKRGLRNSDGTGVLAGVTNIGSVQGYMMLDGDPIPMPGRLYYRGLDINDLIREQVQQRDVMLFYPYHSMTPFLDLLKQSVNDPNV
ncbi:MAG: hypothetical protein IKV51_00420, partial [Clostridia bacterium]|nr:hypothetical protein [Clostridia bacterium]